MKHMFFKYVELYFYMNLNSVEEKIYIGREKLGKMCAMT